MYRLSRNSGSLKLVQPSGPIYTCTGRALPFYHSRGITGSETNEGNPCHHRLVELQQVHVRKNSEKQNSKKQKQKNKKMPVILNVKPVTVKWSTRTQPKACTGLPCSCLSACYMSASTWSFSRCVQKNILTTLFSELAFNKNRLYSFSKSVLNFLNNIFQNVYTLCIRNTNNARRKAFNTTRKCYWSRNSAVGMNDLGFESRQRQKMFLFSKTSSPRPPTQPPTHSVLGVNRPGREINHSSQPKDEVRSNWSYTSTPICLYGVYRYIFNLFIRKCDCTTGNKLQFRTHSILETQEVQ